MQKEKSEAQVQHPDKKAFYDAEQKCVEAIIRFIDRHTEEIKRLIEIETRPEIKENLEEMLEFIAPSIPVGRRFEFKSTNNAQAFYSDSDDIRSIGAEFKRVRYDGSSINEKTLNKGLTIRIDHDEVVDEIQSSFLFMNFLF